jgi:hypothetical protein
MRREGLIDESAKGLEIPISSTNLSAARLVLRSVVLVTHGCRRCTSERGSLAPVPPYRRGISFLADASERLGLRVSAQHAATGTVDSELKHRAGLPPLYCCYLGNRCVVARAMAGSRSKAAAAPRRLTCSFSSILCTWFFTVGRLILSCLAISLFESP